MKIQDKETFEKQICLVWDRKILLSPSILSGIPI